MSDTPDELDDLLAPKPGAPPAALRDELLRRAGRHLARVRWLRRATRAAAVVAIFAAGGVAGWFARPQRVVEVAGETRTVFVPLPVPLPASERSSAEQPVVPPSAPETELRAEQADDRAEAARLYRTAGDAYLRDQDYANATRCYRLYLDRGGDDALSSERGDSWLLTSLKNAAFQEKADVPKTHD